MNYNYLEYFSVLAQLEHYTLAAARLGISQPSLSSAIRNLENELGVKLFEKVGRNIRLTEEGRYFQEKVDTVIKELFKAKEALQNSAEGAPFVIHLGFVSGTLKGPIAQEMQAYAKEFPRCRFHVTEGSAKDLMDLLLQEKLDMAIVDVTSRNRTLHFRMLRQRDFCVVVPKGHPLSGQKSVKAGDLANYPQIGFSHSMDYSFKNWAARSVTHDHYICQVNTVDTALDLVASNIGITIIPQECILPSENLVYIPLQNRHQALYACIIHDRWLDPLVWGFVERAIEAVRNDFRQ